jgi:hypothetical protein
MADLVFKVQPGLSVDPSKTKPVNQLLLNQYKQALTAELRPYIDEINACNGHIAITIEQDGQTFRSLPVTPGRPDLFARIIDEVHSR